MPKYSLTSRFKGYIERDDITNIEPNYLIRGSLNVLSTDSRRVGNRKGYEVFGTANNISAPTQSSFDWLTRPAQLRNLKSYEDSGTVYLQALFNGEWVTISTAIPNADMNFTTFWDTTEQTEVLLFVAHTKDFYVWSGGMTTLDSVTSNSITKEGTRTWAEEGFFLSNNTYGDKQVVIDGIVYTYTGGEGTTTLTGVTPDPTLGGHNTGDTIYQQIITITDNPVDDAIRTNNTIAFVAGSPATITDSANGFVNSGFKNGDVVIVTGSGSNDGTYTVVTVAAGTLTLIPEDTLVNEGAGANVTIEAYRPWTNDIIATLRNQVYIGSFLSREYYVSEVGNYKNYSPPSVPRAVGEPAILQLDSPPVAFIVQEENMYISGGIGDWYQVTFDLSADLLNEQITVRRLDTAPKTSAINQSAVFKIKNDVVFVSQEPTFDSLGRKENINTPQSKPLSDPVENLFQRLDFTDCSGLYFQDNIYIAVPREGLVLVYNLIERFWEAPQTLPIQRFAIIDGELYGHSSVTPETYKLFTGWNDNGNPINAIAQFAYQQFGDRVNMKTFNNWYTEGYIEPNTTLTMTILFEYEGAKEIRQFDIDGSDDTIIFASAFDGSLGKESFGKLNFGGSKGIDEEEALPPKFRIIHTTQGMKAYELSPVYSSNNVDFRWEILAFGPEVYLAKDLNLKIKH